MYAQGTPGSYPQIFDQVVGIIASATNIRYIVHVCTTKTQT